MERDNVVGEGGCIGDGATASPSPCSHGDVPQGYQDVACILWNTVYEFTDLKDILAAKNKFFFE